MSRNEMIRHKMRINDDFVRDERHGECAYEPLADDVEIEGR